MLFGMRAKRGRSPREGPPRSSHQARVAQGKARRLQPLGSLPHPHPHTHYLNYRETEQQSTAPPCLPHEHCWSYQEIVKQGRCSPRVELRCCLSLGLRKHCSKSQEIERRPSVSVQAACKDRQCIKSYWFYVRETCCEACDENDKEVGAVHRSVQGDIDIVVRFFFLLTTTCPHQPRSIIPFSKNLRNQNSRTD